MKPVTQASLTAFFTQRRGRSGGKQGPADDLLQYFIEANGKLQECGSGQANFLTRAINDCLTPATTINGYSRLLNLQRSGAATDQQTEILNRIQRSAERLLHLLSAVLQLAGENRIPEPDRKRDDIRECLAEAAQKLLPFAMEKLVNIEVDCQATPDGLLFERGDVEQVLATLLDNACKFAPRQGVVRVRGYVTHWDLRPEQAEGQVDGAGESPNAFRVDIRDSGPGISEASRRELFLECKSYGGGRDRSGAGLSLAIARMLVERHGGRIWAESDHAGVTFSFLLPYKPGDGNGYVEERE